MTPRVKTAARPPSEIRLQAPPTRSSHPYGSITIAHLANIALRLNRAKLRWDPAKEQILEDAEAAAMLTRPMRGPWELV